MPGRALSAPRIVRLLPVAVLLAAGCGGQARSGSHGAAPPAMSAVAETASTTARTLSPRRDEVPFPGDAQAALDDVWARVPFENIERPRLVDPPMPGYDGTSWLRVESTMAHASPAEYARGGWEADLLVGAVAELSSATDSLPDVIAGVTYKATTADGSDATDAAALAPAPSRLRFGDGRSDGVLIARTDDVIEEYGLRAIEVQSPSGEVIAVRGAAIRAESGTRWTNPRFETLVD